MAQERLNKVMANAGIASRRACDEMIQAGRGTVNGRVVTSPQALARLGASEVTIERQGRRLTGVLR